VTSKQRVGDLF